MIRRHATLWDLPIRLESTSALKISKPYPTFVERFHGNALILTIPECQHTKTCPRQHSRFIKPKLSRPKIEKLKFTSSSNHQNLRYLPGLHTLINDYLWHLEILNTPRIRKTHQLIDLILHLLSGNVNHGARIAITIQRFTVEGELPRARVHFHGLTLSHYQNPPSSQTLITNITTNW